MNPKLRLGIFIAVGTALGIFIGSSISDESFGWAFLAAFVCCWVIVDRVSVAPPDAWLLGATMVGYIVGNRGFAQLQPLSQFPILPAEGVLLCAVPALIVRMVMKRRIEIRNDALNYMILAWIAIGTARIPLDVSRYGVIALRDYAMIYYAAFFFIGQAFGAQPASDRVLKGALTAAFIILPPVVISIQLAPDFLIDHFTFRGVPIIFHKSDLIATSLAGGFYWLWTRMAKSGRRAWVLMAAVSLLLIGVIPSPRAAMAALLVVNILWLLVRRWRICAAQVGIAAAASLITLAAVAMAGKDVKTSAPYSVYEHALSIFDPEGTGSYINAESGDPGSNNRFRLVWWEDVIRETLDTNPVFGLGFGSDLASRFLSEYDPLADESFAARSPHSMLVTVFGRMGLAGFLAWAAVSAFLGRMIWRLFRGGDPDGMGLASLVCVTWISACFGVVLEGPMGAVVFWTAAGLANARALPAEGDGGDDPEAESPIANEGTLGTESAIR